MSHVYNKRRRPAVSIAALLIAAAVAGCEQDSPDAARAKAIEYQKKGEASAAIIVLKTTLEAAPRDPQSRYLLARNYIEVGDPVSAEKEIRLGIAQGHPSNLTTPVLGKSLLQQGKFQNVIDETQNEVGAKDSEVLCLRGDAYLALGRPEDARQLYETVLRTDPSFSHAAIGLGRLSYIVHDVAAANRYAAQALAAQPRNVDALMFKGDLLRAENQASAALATYDQVLAINPVHPTAHVEKAYLQIGMADYPAAEAELKKARQIAPGSVLVAYSQSLLDFSRGANAAAQESITRVLRVAPSHMPSLLLAGAISLNLNSLHQAEHHFRQYLEKNPDNLYARKLLAQTLLRRGNSPEALLVLEPALKGQREDAQLLALAGESYMQASNFDRAAQFFEKASALEPKAAELRTSLAMSKLGKGQSAEAVHDLQVATTLDRDSPKAGIALVRTELSLRHYDRAYDAAVALEKAQPQNAAAHDLKGMALVGKGDLKAARAGFSKALAMQSAYFPAAANLAQLDLLENKPADAKQHLQAFLTANPANVDAMTALAVLASSEKKTEEATQWLVRAAAVDPTAVAPAVGLVSQYLQTGQNQKALDLALQLKVANADNLDLMDLMGKAQLANGDQDGAMATYQKLASAMPRSANVQMQLAAMLMLKKKYAAAEETLKAALALQPDFPAAQLALAELYVRKHWNDLALMTAEKMQRNHPTSSAGFQLAGDVLMADRKPAQAIAAYERAFAITANNELTIKIANALTVAGKPDDAGKRVAQWMQAHPDDLRVQLYQGEMLLAQKKFKPAASHFEGIVKQHPRDVAALNNLAMAYLLSQDPRAATVAEQALGVAGERADVMDTFGWILVEQGNLARGLPILLRASKLAPGASDIRYHVAMGLIKAGDKPAARKELELIVKNDEQFSQIDDVRGMLKQLQ